MKWYVGNIFLWGVYFPLIFLLKNILIFIPQVYKRRVFERKNDTDPGAYSFRHDHLVADLCFEFSSEGEYQQVAGLIEDALHMGKRIELIFFSPSVEKAMIDLYHQYPQQIRYLRFPLLGVSFSSWISSSTLILVRYDLFFEFFLWALRPGRQLKMLWVTFKKERMKNKSTGLVKRAFLRRSDAVIFASPLDQKEGEKWAIKGKVYDFRMEQIKRRIGRREIKFSQFFLEYEKLKNHLEIFPRHKRLILGNAWPEDLFLLKDTPDDICIVIVPHKLDRKIIHSLTQTLESFGRTATLIGEEDFDPRGINTFIIVKKGILCELYSDFGKAYVGGGFGESVHSILEPLVAGCEDISCGPVNYRSTEFDLGQEYGHLVQVNTSDEFQLWLKSINPSLNISEKLQNQFDQYAQFRREILSC